MRRSPPGPVKPGPTSRMASVDQPGQAVEVAQIADFERGMRIAHRERRIDAGDAAVRHLHVGIVGEHADIGAALQRRCRPRARRLGNSATRAGCGMVPFSVPRPWKL